MKISRLLLIVTGALIMTQCDIPVEQKSSHSIKQRMDEKLYPYEGFFLEKTYGGDFSFEAYDSAIKDIGQTTSANRSEGLWKTEGPGNIGARINTIAINPTDPQNILLGYAESGVYRTTDGGDNWEPIFDEQTRLGIGDIEFDPNDSKTILVGTGDPNISGYPVIGDGIWKSTDSGNTWSYLGLEEARIISKIEIANSNSDIIYAGAMGLPFKETSDRGLYKSTDGGETWSKILFVSEDAGVIDLLVHPTNPDIVYAATWNRIRNNVVSTVSGPQAKIHKSIDGGRTWTILETGLPAGDQGRIALAMSGTDPDKIFASYVNTSSDFLGLFKSSDAGDSWSQVNTSEDSGFSPGILGGFGWYFGRLVVNPTDDDNIFILGVDMYMTTNGGVSWELGAPPWYFYEVHADKHDLAFGPGHAYLATDGGAYKASFADRQWVDVENIATTQFYRVAVDPHRHDRYVGGAQDNGTTGGNSTIINEWPRIFGGDGFQPAFDAEDSLVLWVETQRGNVSVSTDGGQSFESAMFGVEASENKNWDMPYFLSVVPGRGYLGTTRVYRNEGGASNPNWTPISPVLIDETTSTRNESITALSESPLNTDVLYAGTGDGQVWRSVDGGDNWDNTGEEVPLNYISDIIASRDLEEVAYLSVSGYKDNDFNAYIYTSTDYGDSWTSIQGDHPMISVNELYSLKGYSSQVLFTATDAGVYFTRDGGVHWDRLGDNMPTLPIYDLDYDEDQNKLVAATFGKGIMTFDLAQVDLTMTNTATEEIEDFDVYLTDGQMLQIKSDFEVSGSHYQIFNMSGQQVTQGTVQSTSLSLGGITSGSYIIKVVKDGRRPVSRKFVVI